VVAQEKGAISGLGVALAVIGWILLYSAFKNQPVATTVRNIIRGEPLATRPGTTPALLEDGAGVVGSAGSGGLNAPARGAASGAVASGGSTTGTAVAQTALGYVGTRYVWGGATPAGWDCSGFVTWVLHHDYGLELPNNRHTLTYGFWGWSGARTVPREQCQPGDLVCWWGHIGIAINGTQMVNARSPFAKPNTQVSNIWTVPYPVIRRPLAYRTASPQLQEVG
jgi:cell wall-associated NlpC family hydrolase